MKTIQILILLSFFAIGTNGKIYYILTKFKDLQSYALKMMQNTVWIEAKSRSQCNKRNMGIYNLCTGLLAAPVFEISSEASPLNSIDKTFHRIDSNALTELMNQCNNRSNIQSNQCHIAGKKFMLSTYNCVNHDSRFTWLAFYPDCGYVGLLFTTIPVISIYALIDQVFKMTPNNQFMTDAFRRSIHKADPSQTEPLCNLKKISQFRLCSICADSLARRADSKEPSPYISKPFRHSTYDMYRDPYFNYYKDEHNHCHNITVSTGTEIHTDALHCDVSIKDVNYKFHVKKNLDTTNDKAIPVYILQNGKIEGETDIKQMPNILSIDSYV